jgi:Zn-dependent M32 family carboxypeptidase
VNSLSRELAGNLAGELEYLHQLLATCANAWRLGYDENGYQSFIQSVEQLRDTIEAHFDQLSDDMEPLIRMLERLDQYVQQKDIMAVQDVVEYEWLPLMEKWKRRWGSQ